MSEGRASGFGRDGQNPLHEGRVALCRTPGTPFPMAAYTIAEGRGYPFAEARLPSSAGRTAFVECRSPLSRGTGSPFFSEGRVPPVRGTETPLSRGTGAHLTSAGYPLNEVPVALSVGRESLFLGREIPFSEERVPLYRGTGAPLPIDVHRCCPVFRCKVTPYPRDGDIYPFPKDG